MTTFIQLVALAILITFIILVVKWHEDRQKKIDEGLKLFAEHFQDLWI